MSGKALSFLDFLYPLLAILDFLYPKGQRAKRPKAKRPKGQKDNLGFDPFFSHTACLRWGGDGGANESGQVEGLGGMKAGANL